MKNLYFLDETEKERILGIHKFATEGQYLIEKLTSTINSDIESSTKYWGVSSDGNVLFLNDSIIVVEENEMKRLEYGFESLHHLLEVTKREYTKKLNESKISWDNYISLPKKFLNEILNTLEISTNVKNNLLYEWDIKFFKDVNVLNEGLDDYLKYDIVDNLWNEVGVITERTWEEWGQQVGGRIKKGFGKIMSGISSVAQKVLVPILKKGIIPFLRWIRTFLNGYFGIITEFIASMFPTVVVVKAVWGLIILLDIYEIYTGDMDPNDPDRREMPYTSMLFDILSFLTTSAVGAASKAAFKSGKGVSKPLLKKVAESLTNLGKSLIDNTKIIIDKLFGKSSPGFFNTIFSGIGKVLDNFYKSIVKTFNIKNWGIAVKQTGKELFTIPGLAKLGIGTAIGTTFATFMEEKSLRKGYKGPEIQIAKQSLINMSNTPKEEGGFPELAYKGPVDNVFDDNLVEVIKKVQKRYNQKITGTINPAMALMLGVTFDIEPSVLENIVGRERLKNFALGLIEAENWLKTKFEGAQKTKK